jgi:hypothetical protein
LGAQQKIQPNLLSGTLRAQPVTFVKEGGERVVRNAALDPLLPQQPVNPGRAELERLVALKPKHPMPASVLPVEKPSDEPEAVVKPYVRGHNNIGAGAEEPGGMKVC